MSLFPLTIFPGTLRSDLLETNQTPSKCVRRCVANSNVNKIFRLSLYEVIMGKNSRTLYSKISILTERIMHEFSSPITPQQNGVVERKNQTLQEMARAMLHAKNVSLHCWAESLNTACYIHNRIWLRSGTTKTNYELWRGRKPNIRYFHVFGSV